MRAVRAVSRGASFLIGLYDALVKIPVVGGAGRYSNAVAFVKIPNAGGAGRFSGNSLSIKLPLWISRIWAVRAVARML
jgi:hypothetical protein